MKTSCIFRMCPVCGKIFEPARHSQKYCSAECRAKMRRKNQYYETPVKRYCVVCGRLFKTTHKYKQYCSQKCRYKAQAKPQAADKTEPKFIGQKPLGTRPMSPALENFIQHMALILKDY